MRDSRPNDSALLPSGFADLLGSEAEMESALRATFLSACRTWGYRLVAPPLCEFAPSLAGAGESLGEDNAGEVSAFRFLDPASRRMLALRSDITPQVARLADTRLQTAPRPLRLCYAGEVLRVGAQQIDHERQRLQMGAELIGADSTAAQVEVILLTCECLAALGVKELSVDLVWSRLGSLWLDALALDEAETLIARNALALRDETALAKVAGGALLPLLRAVGSAREVLAQAQKESFPEVLREPLSALGQLVEALEAEADSLPAGTSLTADLAESRDFSYQTGPDFSIFSPSARTEIGRGGVYRTAGGAVACGFSLYGHQLRRVLLQQGGQGASPEETKSVYAAFGVSRQHCARLRKEGWAVVQGLEKTTSAHSEAERLGCGYLIETDTEEPKAL